MDVVSYWARHITLHLDNDQGTYDVVNGFIRDVLTDSGLTISEFRAMTERERREQFASPIGERVLQFVHELFGEVIYGNGFGSSLIADLLPSEGDTELQYAIGATYVPDVADASAWLLSVSDE